MEWRRAASRAVMTRVPLGWIGTTAVKEPWSAPLPARRVSDRPSRSEEHTSELPSLMRISYAVFCLKKKHHTHPAASSLPPRPHSPPPPPPTPLTPHHPV